MWLRWLGSSVCRTRQCGRLRTLYVAIGIDCDPDRDVYPEVLSFRGVEAIPELLHDLPDVRWTLNVRQDSQIEARLGSVDHCLREYEKVFSSAVDRGSMVALHLHYYGADGNQDVRRSNVARNVMLGTRSKPDVVHMGWTYQDAESVELLGDAGVKVDYSPLPGMKFRGRNGSDSYDWSGFAYRPQVWRGVRMIPAYTYKDALLSRRFGSDRVMLTTCTHPILYDRLLRSFFDTGMDFFVSYFHADELVSALPDWRRWLYSRRHLRRNLDTLVDMASRDGFGVEFVTVRDLSEKLFGEYDPRDA